MASMLNPERGPERQAERLAERHLEPTRTPQRGSGPFLPMLLLALAFVAWSGFQSWQLLAERAQLARARIAQQPTMDNAAKLRAALDGVATGTQRLAAAGNPSAEVIVEELRRRGVTINADASTKAP